MSDDAKMKKAIAEGDVYERVMSENEFRIRQYSENVPSSRLRPERVLRLIRMCHEGELFQMDLDMTQCFKTGWLQPGHRMIKAFGYNPAGERSEESQKLVAFLQWIIDQNAGAQPKVSWKQVSVEKVLGTFGLKSARAQLLEWLHANHGASKVGASNPEALVKEYLNPKDEREMSPMWLEVAAILPNKEDPKEVHDCESPGIEDPKLVIRCGFKQNDVGYYVLMPQLAAFYRTIEGIFTDIEQRSFYPYYPFTADEQKILLAGIDQLMANPEWSVILNGPSHPVPPPVEGMPPVIPTPITVEKLKAFRSEIEKITDERGPQPADGGKKEEDPEA